MAPEEIFSQLSIWIVNVFLRSYTFLPVFLFLPVWMRIHKVPEHRSTTLPTEVYILHRLVNCPSPSPVKCRLPEAGISLLNCPRFGHSSICKYGTVLNNQNTFKTKTHALSSSLQQVTPGEMQQLMYDPQLQQQQSYADQQQHQQQQHHYPDRRYDEHHHRLAAYTDQMQLFDRPDDQDRERQLRPPGGRLADQQAARLAGLASPPWRTRRMEEGGDSDLQSSLDQSQHRVRFLFGVFSLFLRIEIVSRNVLLLFSGIDKKNNIILALFSCMLMWGWFWLYMVRGCRGLRTVSWTLRSRRCSAMGGRCPTFTSCHPSSMPLCSNR